MRFAWDPSEFGGIKVLRVDPSLVWFPDITLYNRSVTRLNTSLCTNGDKFNRINTSRGLTGISTRMVILVTLTNKLY